MEHPHAAEQKYNEIIGANIKKARLMAGENQTQLGKALGLTFQQVQKYERGTNRIGAGKLHIIATHYKLGSVLPLYEGVTHSLAPRGVGLPAIAEPDANTRLQLELSRAASGLPRSVVRAMLNLARSVMSAGEDDEAEAA